MFLRKGELARDPLVVAMSGVQRGERILQVGLNDATHAGLVAQKAGLTGYAVLVAPDFATATKASATVAPSPVVVADMAALPFAEGRFDVAVINGADGVLAGLGARLQPFLAQLHQVVRRGGRVVSVEPGTPAGLLGRFKAPSPAVTAYQSGGGTVAALTTAGFRPARELADSEGLRFVEGLRQ